MSRCYSYLLVLDDHYHALDGDATPNRNKLYHSLFTMFSNGATAEGALFPRSLRSWILRPPNVCLRPLLLRHGMEMGEMLRLRMYADFVMKVSRMYWTMY